MDSRLLASLKLATVAQLDEGLEKIEHCLRQLDEPQFWDRPDDWLNSIANLLLHLSGNIRQWLICGLTSEVDNRQRQAEFDDRSGRSKAELLAELTETIGQAKKAIQSQEIDDLLKVRRVQQFDFDGTQVILDSLCHFRGHVQEIIHMTRKAKGSDYEFAFVPESKTK